MSGHSLPYEMLTAPWSIKDPGNAGTLNLLDRGMAVCVLKTAGAETRTIPAPSTLFQRLQVFLDTDGGDVTITVNGGVSGLTSIVLGDVGDAFELVAITVAGQVKWQVAWTNGPSSGTNEVIGGTLEVTGAATFDSTISAGADKLTEGGIIVPQQQTLVNETISLHASKTIYNLFTARDAWQITNIDYTPDTAQGGALTATAVKAIGTATPAAATTPLHIAGAIDLNAAAHTVQPITLTVTGADLQLAAGNRIGLVLSGAMTVGSGNICIRGKRI